MPERVAWTPELVAGFWDALARTRLLELSFGKLAGPYLLTAIRPYLDPSKRVLDFGSGDGHFVRHLVANGFRAAAFEPSHGRQMTIAANVGNEPGFLGFVGPDYDGPRFDVICMFEVIEHILEEALPEAFALIDRLLAPDGLLIITTPNNEDLELGSCVDPRGTVLFHRWQHVRSLTVDTLSQLVGRFAFAPVVVNQIEFSDVVFGPGGGRLASLAEYANLFNTYRPLLIGNGDRLMAVTARTATAATMREAVATEDAWSRAPVVVPTRTEIVPPQTGIPPYAPRATARAVALGAIAPRDRWRTLNPARMRKEGGHGWRIDLRLAGAGDRGDRADVSVVELFEDHLPLGPRHSAQEAIGRLGRGRFSHAGTTLHFASSDNTDPRRNGRVYRVRFPSALGRLLRSFRA